MNMPPRLEAGAVGDKAERHSVKTVDAFCVLDLDRTLLDTEKAFNVFVDAVHEVGFIDGYEVHDAVLESGGSFDVLAYVRKELSDRLDPTGSGSERIESIVADIKAEYIKRAKEENLLLPGALELLTELDGNDMPYGILTFGGDEWQGWKLEAARLDTVPTIVTRRKDKAAMMRDSWRRKILGGFQLPEEFMSDGYRIIAKKLLFLDDKLESLDGAPDDVLAIHVIDDSKEVKRADYRGKNITVARGLAKAATILTAAGYLSGNRH